MSVRPCGFKVQDRLGTQQELTSIKKAGEGRWTLPSQRANRLKLLDLAVAFGRVRGLVGRWLDTSNNEHDTTDGGRTDE